MPIDKDVDSQPMSRRDFLKLKWLYLAGAGLVGTGLLAYLQYEAEQSSGNEEAVRLNESVDGNKSVYAFSLKEDAQGEFFDRLRNIQAITGLNSFKIEVDPENDNNFTDLMDQVLTDDVIQKFSSLDRPKALSMVTKRVLETMDANEVSYYPWSKSDQNLQTYLTYPPEIGKRIKNNIYTCFESAVFTKEVFKRLGLDIPIAFIGIHANLDYKGPEGQFAIEPLMGKVFNQK